MRSLRTKLSVVALGAAVLVSVGCDKSPALAPPEPPVVTVSKPLPKPITDFDQYTGRIEAVETVEVRSRVRGELVGIHFKDGAMVAKDELLFTIDPRTYKAAVAVSEAKKANAEANLKLATAEYERTYGLYKMNAASAREVEVWVAKKGIALAEVSQAEAELERSNLDLEFTKIRAPIAGRISKALTTKGNLVNAGGGDTLLTTIVSVDPIFVYFDVDERSLHLFRERREKDLARAGKGRVPFSPLFLGLVPDIYGIVSTVASVRPPVIPVFLGLVADGDRFPREGKIDFAENRLNPTTGTIRVRGVFDNDDGKLTPGQFARVRLPVGEKYDGLLVTDAAIGIDQGQKYLLIVNDKKKAEYRAVTPGRLEGDLRIFPPGAGLKADEWVIVNGVQRVRPGIDVRPEAVAMPTRTADPKATAKAEGDKKAK